MIIFFNSLILPAVFASCKMELLDLKKGSGSTNFTYNHAPGKYYNEIIVVADRTLRTTLNDGQNI